MPTLRRKSAGSQLLDLTQRLAEEYASVPLAEVRRTVQEAADLVATTGAGSGADLHLIERIARDELSDLVRPTPRG